MVNNKGMEKAGARNRCKEGNIVNRRKDPLHEGNERG